MPPRRRVPLVIALLVSAGLAGCAGEAATTDDGEGLTPGATGGSGAPLSGGGTPPPAETVAPRGTSERWHYHDYWKGDPTITLLNTTVTLNATVQEDGTPALSALVELPNGVVVPPETGHLTFNASWEGGTGLVNLTYRPADSPEFHPAGDLSASEGVVLETTESMCDVPHRQQSLWLFNLSAKPGVEASHGVPMREVQFTIQATIGRPLFIDPPHFDWWQGEDTVPLVEDFEGQVALAATPATNASLDVGRHHAGAESARVSVDEGRIVPEDTRTLVVMLNWTSDVPAPAKLAVAYRELNYPSQGFLEVAVDGEGQRIFTLPVRAAQTDTTYSNRTTWQFRVVPEGDPAAAFEGTFAFAAWVSKLAPAEAISRVTT